MQFKVPQDVQREDIILWFITFKQFIILLAGFGLSYFLLVQVKKNYNISDVEAILIWIPAMISVAVAFVKINGIPLFQFILLAIENAFFRPPRRYWIHGMGEPFVSFTTNFSMKKQQKKEDLPPEKDLSEKKIRSLATMLDHGKK